MLAYRGFMLDSVRHMQSVNEIKKLIDAISFLGFNKFHWHLTDDQGWRFESELYPELNSVSAVRQYSDFGKIFSDQPYGRVYTKDEIKEVLSYCETKGIEVIPEFDIPGHTSALLAAFPELSCLGENVSVKTRQGIFDDVLCIGKEEAYEKVISIFDEILKVFPGKYIHIGGDEAPSHHWKHCSCCQKKMKELGINSYSEYQNTFMNRIIDYLESRGRHCIVWNDSVKGNNLDKRAIVQYWKEKPASMVEYLNNGGKCIFSPFSYCYLDYDYNITPLNRIYSLEFSLRGLSEKGKKNIIGIEAPVWTEYIDDDKNLEEMLFPRLIAVSELASQKTNRNYNDFLNNVYSVRKQLKEISFADEKLWTKPRLAMPFGWLKFVKEHYTADFIKEQIF